MHQPVRSASLRPHGSMRVRARTSSTSIDCQRQLDEIARAESDRIV